MARAVITGLTFHFVGTDQVQIGELDELSTVFPERAQNEENPSYKMQFFVKSVTSFAVQSPLGFSFIFAHHSLEPTSGEQAIRPPANSATARLRIPFFMLWALFCELKLSRPRKLFR